MKGKLTLQQRLILPIILLGLITLLSNLLAVFSLHNVHTTAGDIVDTVMVSEERLSEIRRSVMDLHRLALSHIVASDHETMIRLVREIKAGEADLDAKLNAYAAYVPPSGETAYHALAQHYEQFRHALVRLACASADSRTAEAYATANGAVADSGAAVESDLDTLAASAGAQAEAARGRLTLVYLISLITSALTLGVGIFLVAAAFRIVRRYVLLPIHDAMYTLQISSEEISGVVDKVRRRARTSNHSVQRLSDVTQQLSEALAEVAGSAASIRSNASGTHEDAQGMAEECAAITAYSVEMRRRAEEMERSARQETETVRARTEEIMAVLEEAIEKSQNVEQIRTLTEDILSITSTTNLIAVNASIEATRAGTSGHGFSIVAHEINQLANSCTETASHIQAVSEIVLGAVSYLSQSARELADYLGSAIVVQLEQSVQAGRQYHEDADYIGHAMDAFNGRTERLQTAMAQISESISSISGAIDGAASGISGAAGSTHVLVDDRADITSRMDTNQKIVGQLQKQMDVFANL